MFCQKCGHQLDDNQKFCHKCGAATVNAPVLQSSSPQYQLVAHCSAPSPIDDDDEEEEEEVEEEFEEDDDSGSSGFWFGLVKILFIALAIWALIHYNPSEKKQADVVTDELAKIVRRNPDALWTAAYVKSNLQYQDLWIVSWTYVEPKGRNVKGAFGNDYVLCSVGFCGMVIPCIDIKTYRK